MRQAESEFKVGSSGPARALTGDRHSSIGNVRSARNGDRRAGKAARQGTVKSMTGEAETVRPSEELIAAALAVLGKRNLVFVGLMGAGKSAIGRIVSQMLSIPFVDSDHEIERVSRMTIPELFSAYGEPEFRGLEQRVIRRLLKSGPRVVSTGGGAFMNEATRQTIAALGISVWLKADLEVLFERVSRRDNRPLLKTEDPKGTLASLMAARYPIYETAAITVVSREADKDVIAREVIEALAGYEAPQGKDVKA